uniref:AMP-activated protein kinase gamma subunit n=1 Tax=Echinococcus granulosus TaxID=6210 RepID=H9M5Q3_ECHGR|nr:AMP-activated protein kinase gamma subunit [Echinococcus granulosus]
MLVKVNYLTCNLLTSKLFLLIHFCVFILSVDSPLPFSVESISEFFSPFVNHFCTANVNDAYRIFLKHHTSYDLIPLSAKLIVFDVSLNVSFRLVCLISTQVKKGFFALVYNGVRVAILWDSECQEYVGLLTITDFIRILHKYYKSPEIPIVELEEHQIKTWREQMSDYAPSLIYITPERTLLDAVQMLLEHKVHRLPILDPLTGNPLHILTHKRLLKYLHFNVSSLAPLLLFVLLPHQSHQLIVQLGPNVNPCSDVVVLKHTRFTYSGFIVKFLWTNFNNGIEDTCLSLSDFLLQFVAFALCDGSYSCFLLLLGNFCPSYSTPCHLYVENRLNYVQKLNV